MKLLIAGIKTKKHWNFTQKFVYIIIHNILKQYFKGDYILFQCEWKYFKQHMFLPINSFYKKFQSIPENKDLSERGLILTTLKFLQKWAEYRKWPDGFQIWIKNVYEAWYLLPHTNPEMIDWFGKVSPYVIYAYEQKGWHLPKK